MKVRVFYRIHAEMPPRRESLEIGALDVKGELAKLRGELEKAQNEQERKNIQRKIVRLEKFEEIQDGKVGSQKKDEIQAILKGKNTENYLGSDLHMLRKRGVDIASLTLVKESNPTEAAKSSEMKAGDTFIVNFGGNESLKKKVGAGDILPPEIKNIKIHFDDGKVFEYERRESPRPWYYNDTLKYPYGPYGRIYDWYKIEVLSTSSISEDDKRKAYEAAEKRWRKIRTQDMIENNNWNPLVGMSEEKTLFSEVTIEKNRRERMRTLDSLGLIERGEFIHDAKEAAKKVEEYFGIPWQVAFGQAVLESWYGKHAPNNNYFGIKWEGDSLLSTQEYLNWSWTTEKASFRWYSSLQDSFLWYGKFLTENPRYRNAFDYNNNPKDFLIAIKQAWYATDPNYIGKIEKIWKDNNIPV